MATQDEQWNENKDMIDDSNIVKCNTCGKYFTPETKFDLDCHECMTEGEAQSDEERGN